MKGDVRVTYCGHVTPRWASRPLEFYDGSSFAAWANAAFKNGAKVEMIDGQQVLATVHVQHGGEESEPE